VGPAPPDYTGVLAAQHAAGAAGCHMYAAHSVRCGSGRGLRMGAAERGWKVPVIVSNDSMIVASAEARTRVHTGTCTHTHTCTYSMRPAAVNLLHPLQRTSLLWPLYSLVHTRRSAEALLAMQCLQQQALLDSSSSGGSGVNSSRAQQDAAGSGWGALLATCAPVLASQLRQSGAAVDHGAPSLQGGRRLAQAAAAAIGTASSNALAAAYSTLQCATGYTGALCASCVFPGDAASGGAFGSFYTGCARCPAWGTALAGYVLSRALDAALLALLVCTTLVEARRRRGRVAAARRAAFAKLGSSAAPAGSSGAPPHPATDKADKAALPGSRAASGGAGGWAADALDDAPMPPVDGHDQAQPTQQLSALVQQTDADAPVAGWQGSTARDQGRGTAMVAQQQQQQPSQQLLSVTDCSGVRPLPLLLAPAGGGVLVGCDTPGLDVPTVQQNAAGEGGMMLPGTAMVAATAAAAMAATAAATGGGAVAAAARRRAARRPLKRGPLFARELLPVGAGAAGSSGAATAASHAAVVNYSPAELTIGQLFEVRDEQCK
jgi:hypothetical protein